MYINNIYIYILFIYIYIYIYIFIYIDIFSLYLAPTNLHWKKL